MDPSFCPKNSADSYTKSTSTRNLEVIKSILLPQSLDIQNSFFSFFTFLVTSFRYSILLIRIQRQRVDGANEYKQKYLDSFHVCVYILYTYMGDFMSTVRTKILNLLKPV